MLINQDALARRQQSDFSVFEPSCHLPTCLSHMVEASYFHFLLLNAEQESCEYQCLKSLTESGNRVYRFSSRFSIHSTTNRFCLAKLDRLTDKNIAKVTQSQSTASILPSACINASRIELLEVCLECGIAEELGGGGRFCSAFIHHIL